MARDAITHTNQATRLAIGIMSGTSLDGIDAVLIKHTNHGLETLGHASVDIDPALRADLIALSTQTAFESDPIEMLGRARLALTDHYANAVAQLPAALRDNAVVIGAHGQTIRHRPEFGYSLQLLDGARLAVRTCLPVVCDLRSADLAAGGQGAPLVPVFHAAAFGITLNPTSDAPAVVVNIGGIANISVIGQRESVLAGFDTGPGNRLLDDWCQQHRQQPFDKNGEWAASGQVDNGLLNQLLADPYFSKPAPKSTGREQFNMQWLSQQLSDNTRQAQDVQATLVELTARTISDAAIRFNPSALLVCGGGAFNKHLMQRIAALTNPVPCSSTSRIGLEPEHVEAAAFAWLALQRIDERAVRLSGATGATVDTVSGALHMPAPKN